MRERKRGCLCWWEEGRRKRDGRKRGEKVVEKVKGGIWWWRFWFWWFWWGCVSFDDFICCNCNWC